MSDAIIKVENLGKNYRIRHQAERQRYVALRDVLADKTKSVARRLWSAMANPQSAIRNPQSVEDFWALKDVSFEVKPGEVVGIIGRNGAGKSTLLKILSRITEPTTGRIELDGRVASLLEVGTGFHPELTGRENIYLNGAILGMTRVEIARKFDEIVAFAEVEKFLDTPVKRYSSGMHVRLAFAVAAHLEPEILIVDEVLAVGDAAFQRKCLNKMETVSQHGRTVLFVSHNMPTVLRLCRRGILLHEGRVLEDGLSHEVTHTYMHNDSCSSAERVWPDPRRMPGNETARLHAVRVLDHQGVASSTHDIRRPIVIEMDYEVLTGDRILIPNLHLYNDEGTCAFVTGDTDLANRRTPRPRGFYRSRVRIPGNFLSEGGIFVTVALSTVNPILVHFCERDAVAFQIHDEGGGDTVRGDYAGPFPGVVRPLLEWSSEHLIASPQSSQFATVSP